jgi:septal ring factor EnvC (AmiA/AmiB activator)
MLSRERKPTSAPAGLALPSRAVTFPITLLFFEPILAIFMEHVVNNCKSEADRRSGRVQSPFLQFWFARTASALPASRPAGMKQARGRAIYHFALYALVILSHPVAALAADSTHQLNRAIDQQKSELNETRANKGQLRLALRTTQQKLDETEHAQNALEDQISAIEEKIDQLETQKDALSMQIAQLRPQIASNLRLAYALGDQATLGTLLAHTDALTTERNLHYIKALLSEALSKMAQLKQAEKDQITNQQTLKTSHNALIAAHEALASTLQQRKVQQTAQNQLLTAISTQVDQQSQHLGALLAQKKELDMQIARINAEAARARAERRAEMARHEAANPPRSGKTPDDEDQTDGKAASAVEPGSPGAIPVRGKIIRAYGAPIADGDMRAQGILFSAPQNTPFRAVAAGKVVFADTMKGWGNLVIIRHANGYLSLYAHASELRVHTGMRVSQGTELGLCGQIEGRNSGLYFEVRRGNDTINPSRWSVYRNVSTHP